MGFLSELSERKPPSIPHLLNLSKRKHPQGGDCNIEASSSIDSEKGKTPLARKVWFE